MGIIYADNEVSGIEAFQEYLCELISDTNYEKGGPKATCDPQDWEDLEEEERQIELDAWSAPSEERRKELDTRLAILNEVWDLTNKVIKNLYDRASAERTRYNQERSRQGRTTSPAYMSDKEAFWRKYHNRR